MSRAERGDARPRAGAAHRRCSTTRCPPSASRRRRSSRATPPGCSTSRPAARSTTAASPTCPTLLRPGDLLVANDTRVRAARLRGARDDGGQAEVLLLERLDGERFTALVRPGRRLHTGRDGDGRRHAARHRGRPRAGPPGGSRGHGVSRPSRRRGGHRRARRGAAAAVHPHAARRPPAATRRCTRPATPASAAAPDGRAPLHRARATTRWRAAGRRLGDAPARRRPRHLRPHHRRRRARPPHARGALHAARGDRGARSTDARAPVVGWSRWARPWCAPWSPTSTRRGGLRAGHGLDRPLHHPGPPLRRRRRPAHQLPPAALVAAGAAGRVHRRRRWRRAYEHALAARLPLPQLRRLHALLADGSGSLSALTHRRRATARRATGSRCAPPTARCAPPRSCRWARTPP